jgi:hypothetical protein
MAARTLPASARTQHRARAHPTLRRGAVRWQACSRLASTRAKGAPALAPARGAVAIQSVPPRPPANAVSHDTDRIRSHDARPYLGPQRVLHFGEGQSTPLEKSVRAPVAGPTHDPKQAQAFVQRPKLSRGGVEVVAGFGAPPLSSRRMRGVVAIDGVPPRRRCAEVLGISEERLSPRRSTSQSGSRGVKVAVGLVLCHARSGGPRRCRRVIRGVLRAPRRKRSVFAVRGVPANPGCAGALSPCEECHSRRSVQPPKGVAAESKS